MSFSGIHFDSATRSFLLVLKSSYYAMRLDGDGRLLHVGSGPLPHGMPAESVSAFTGLEAYEEPNYVWEQQATRHELPAFGDVSYHDVALKVAFPRLAGELAPGDAPHLPVRDVRLRYHSHQVLADAVPALAPQHGIAPRKGQARETLSIRLLDANYAFAATLNFRLTPECDVIERWVELENGTDMDVAVEELAFGSVNLPAGNYELTHCAGIWAREFEPVRTPLSQGRFVLDQRGLNTGHATNPFYLLNPAGQAYEEGGTVYFGGLAYSGNWSLRFEVLPGRSLRVLGGYETADFALTLAPGEKFVTPAFVHGACAGGYGGASRRMHSFARDYILPGFGEDEYRPVLYNSWEATYFNLSLEGQSGLARVAADLGVELFCVDDGWFGGRRSDNAGLGDWTVSPEVFPDGLAPLVQVVKGLGMKFGLWVEPEMVNPDSELYRAHPDWVLHFPGRPRTEIRNQLILDFGRPEVVEYIFNALDKLVAEYGIDFFKWDMNRYASEPGSVAGRAIWRSHVAGVYSIMDRLKARHRGLSIQSCSGGGGRIDLGMLGRADQVWTSDNTDAVDRVTIEDGFSLFYPLRAMESWVTHEENHQTGRATSLDLRFDVAMRGALGIGTVLTSLTEEEKAIYRRKIAFYKRIRPVVQGGNLYRLRPEHDFSVWQIVAQDQSAAVYSQVVTGQLQGIYFAPAPLRGLLSDATYRVTDEHDAELGQFSGLQLMTLGMPGETAHGGAGKAIRSRTLYLEKVA